MHSQIKKLYIFCTVEHKLLPHIFCTYRFSQLRRSHSNVHTLTHRSKQESSVKRNGNSWNISHVFDYCCVKNAIYNNNKHIENIFSITWLMAYNSFLRVFLYFTTKCVCFCICMHPPSAHFLDLSLYLISMEQKTWNTNQ